MPGFDFPGLVRSSFYLAAFLAGRGVAWGLAALAYLDAN
jgi:hypothetical protein